MSATAPRWIVTGASGFIGRVFAGCAPRDSVRVALGGDDWRERIAAAPWRGATVYHLAARVHQPQGDESLFERDNVAKTIELAQAAASAGARRLVFLSTIKVNGDETLDRAFRPDDPPAPRDAYARSKWAAEKALLEISQARGLSLAIVRAPLVIGAGAGGNLRSLMRFADGPWPLPFAAIDNRRTFVCVEDLARLLAICGSSPDARGDIFFAGDPQPVSTPRLVACIRSAWNRPARLFRVDARNLERIAALAGLRERVGRLTRSLEVDVSDTIRRLAWKPAIDMEAGIARMARAYHAHAGA